MQTNNLNPTIRETFTHFLHMKESDGLTKSTIDNYIISLQVFLTDNGIDDTEEISYLNSIKIMEWSRYMQEMQTRAVPSINHYLRDIRVYCNFLSEFYELPTVRIKLIKEQKKFRERYDDEELKKLLLPPKRTDPYHYWRTWLIISVMLGTGARIHSVLSLKKSDITEDTIRFTETKNKNELVLPLSNFLWMNINRYLSIWNVESDYLFLSSKEGRSCTRNGSYQALQDYCKERGIECKGWHSFRATFAYKCYTSGMDIVTLMHWLSHSSIEQTRHYIGSLGITDLRQVELPLDSLSRKKSISRK